MNEFYVWIKSPSWWVGVVGVSLLINILSTYGSRLLDRLGGRISEKRRLSAEKQQSQFRADVEEALSTPDGLVLIYLKNVLAMLKVVGLFVLSVGMFNVPTTDPFGISLHPLVRFFAIMTVLSLSMLSLRKSFYVQKVRIAACAERKRQLSTRV